MACPVFDSPRHRGTVGRGELVHSFTRHHDFDRGYGPEMNRLLQLLREGGSWRDLAAGLFEGRAPGATARPCGSHHWEPGSP